MTSDPIVARLRRAGSVFAEDEAALLVASTADPQVLDTLVARRVAGEPLEQVLGWVEVGGRRLTVAPGVFVPRARTVLLARTAIKLLPRDGRLLDLCCGVGTVAALVHAVRSDVVLHASDVDPRATACASTNLPSATVHTGDLFAPLPDGPRFDVVAVNAPYVPTDEIAHMPPEARDHEPHATLDGGPDGIAWHRRVAAEVRQHLAPAGVVAIETGRHQVPLTAAALEACGFRTDVVVDDEVAGTVVIGRAAEPADPI